jgi:hypothetical protein
MNWLIAIPQSLGNFTGFSISFPNSPGMLGKTWVASAESYSSGKVVRIAGLEPARLAALPPQSSVSANSTICAEPQIMNHAVQTAQGQKIFPTETNSCATPAFVAY